ncbi:MAG: hypothetical protein CSB44_06840 [Gammaproteobacteria bacterium]|nr:MAG: hypothetical protein CSB44_06840 [Gammaproteobacteria bacterium]
MLPARSIIAFLLLISTLWTTTAFALESPQVSARRDGSIVRLVVANGDAYSGYNIYRDGKYTLTVRPSGSMRSFNVPAKVGQFCVVGFNDSSAPTRYSTCSNTLNVTDSDGPLSVNSNGDDSDGAGSDSDGGSDDAGGNGGGTVAAPANLRVQRYSSTAAELFWARPNGTAPVRYRVLRNGSEVLNSHVFSYFQEGLDPATTYRYEVQSIAADGSKSAVASVELPGVGGSGSNGGASGDDSGSSGGNDEPSGSGGAEVVVKRSDIVLTEGEPVAITVPLEVTRDDSRLGAVELSLEAVSGDALDNMSAWFEPERLERGKSKSKLRMRLEIDVAPILEHERRFRLVARAGDGSDRVLASKEFPVRMLPVSAPDVYLLIGQSNMEGYSEWDARQRWEGGLDAPHERIRQLNVRQNNRGIFNADWKFTNEGENIHHPTYITAEDPLHEPWSEWQGYKSGNHIGPGLTFAKSALRHTSQTIYLVPAAWGATGFCANVFGNIAWNARPRSESWLGNTLLADRALTRLNMTLRDTGGIFRGILWHQGGADSNDANCANAYRDNLKALARRLRSEAREDRRGKSARGEDSDVPFIVATQSRGKDERGDYSVFSSTKRIVDRAHREVSTYIPHSDYVDNDDLVPPSYPCGSSSCVHFGAAAYRETGRRFSAALRHVVEH